MASDDAWSQQMLAPSPAESHASLPDNQDSNSRQDHRTATHKTCISCAKAKVRCSKHSPCARCIRLGLPCYPQPRGRGRPRKNSQQSTPQSGERELPDSSSTNQGGPQREHIVDYLRSCLMTNPVAEKDHQRRAKCAAVIRWLLLMAKKAQDERLFDKSFQLAELARVSDKDLPRFELDKSPLVASRTPHLGGLDLKPHSHGDSESREMPDELPQVSVPPYITALHSEACSVMVRVTTKGGSFFFTNRDFDRNFFTADQANVLYKTSNYDTAVVMEHIIGSEDRASYLQCVSQLLLGNADSYSEGSLIATCRTQQPNLLTQTSPMASPPATDAPVQLPHKQVCLIQMRCYIDHTGDMQAMCHRIIPLPQSNYLANPKQPSRSSRKRKTSQASNSPLESSIGPHSNPMMRSPHTASPQFHPSMLPGCPTYPPACTFASMYQQQPLSSQQQQQQQQQQQLLVAQQAQSMPHQQISPFYHSQSSAQQAFHPQSQQSMLMQQGQMLSHQTAAFSQQPQGVAGFQHEYMPPTQHEQQQRVKPEDQAAANRFPPHSQHMQQHQMFPSSSLLSPTSSSMAHSTSSISAPPQPANANELLEFPPDVLDMLGV